MSLANEEDMSETGEECIMVTGDFCGGEEEVICVETANGERVINADGEFGKEWERFHLRSSGIRTNHFRSFSSEYFTADGNIIESSEVYTDEPQEVEITIDNDGNPQEEAVIELQVSSCMSHKRFEYSLSS